MRMKPISYLVILLFLSNLSCKKDKDNKPEGQNSVKTLSALTISEGFLMLPPLFRGNSQF